MASSAEAKIQRVRISHVSFSFCRHKKGTAKTLQQLRARPCLLPELRLPAHPLHSNRGLQGFHVISPHATRTPAKELNVGDGHICSTLVSILLAHQVSGAKSPEGPRACTEYLAQTMLTNSFIETQSPHHIGTGTLREVVLVAARRGTP